MNIDDYLREKKALEEQKAILEGKEKISEKKEIKKSPTPPSESLPTGGESRRSGSSVRTLMIVNTVILLGVLGIFAMFYLFPPGSGNPLVSDDGSAITGKVIANENTKTTTTTSATTTSTTTGKNDTENKNDTNDTTLYLGPQFDLFIEDVTEGAFDDRGRLENSGEILVFNGPIFYNDFEIMIQNKEPEKILCAVDRQMDVDTDLDGRFDIEGIHSLNRHSLKIKPAAEEIIRAGIESIPGNVKDYKGKGEVAVEYEVRCYFCLDERCESYEKKGEETRRSFFRVRINEHLIIEENNDTNKSS